MNVSTPPAELCIFRLSAIGDVTHVMPVVQAIRNEWPQTRITWIIGTLEHRLLQGMTGVEFIPFDKKGGWSAIRQLRSALHGRAFDILLHMQVAARANLLSRLVRAPVRIGWDRKRSRDGHQWFITDSIEERPYQHQVEGFLEFARKIGLAPDQPQWRFPVGEEEENWARDKISGSTPSLVISPCSSHTLRNWSAERYAEVADFASEKLGMQVILMGGPGPAEHAMAREIEAHMNSVATNLVGKDTLKQSVALLRAADVLISPDSGPAHIASAVGTPVIGLYAATWSQRSGPYHSLELCVDRFEEAARRYRKREARELRWGTRIEKPGVMDLVSVDDVKEKLQIVSRKMTSQYQ